MKWVSDIKQGKLCVFVLDEYLICCREIYVWYVWGKKSALRRGEVEITNEKTEANLLWNMN